MRWLRFTIAGLMAVIVYAASGLAPTRPYFREMVRRNEKGEIVSTLTRNVTKNNLETLSVPLAAFAGVKLGDVRAVEIEFDPAQPDDIFIDTLSLIRKK